MGDGVSKDGAKATQYSKLGALAGCETSSIKLGLLDANAGRFDWAIKHWLIAAKCWDIRAVNKIKRSMVQAHATKEQYAHALIQFQEYLNEVKSEQRDDAAAHNDQGMSWPAETQQL